MQAKAYIALITKSYDTEIFSAALPRQKPQSSNYDVIFAVTSELELWASAGGKAAEKNPVTNHFVIRAM